MENHRTFLLAQPIFARVPTRSQAFRDFIQNIELCRYDKSEEIYRQGEPSTDLYLIRDGEVHIMQRLPGHSRLVGILARGNLFGEVSLMTGEAHSSDAIAGLDSTVYCIPGDEFLKLLTAEPAVGQNLARILSTRLKSRMTLREEETPSRIHVLFYPENSRRGGAMCRVLGQALEHENPDRVLVFCLSPTPVFESDRFATLGEIMNRWPAIDLPGLFERETGEEYTVLLGHEIHEEGFNLDALTNFVPALLGRLRKYFSAILVDAGSEADNPVIARVLSQSDDILLVKDPRASTSSQAGEKWREVSSFCTELLDDFFDRVITISDERGGRRDDDDAHWRAAVNPNSALYRNHVRLRSIEEAIDQTHVERSFQIGINRLARRLSDTSRGLALGGGGARAFAQVGVLEVFEEAGIDFDCIAGTSMGAVIGAAYALGRDSKEIASMLSEILPNSNAILDKRLPFVSFFRGHRLNRAIRSAFGDNRFEDTEIPFYCNGTDLDTARTLIFERGFLSPAIRASVSLPGVFPPFRLGNYTIVDGGVSNNLPGNVLLNKGYDRIIGINVTPFEDRRAGDTAVEDRHGGLMKRVMDYFSLPPILKIINRSIAIQGIELMRHRLSDFDYVIHPEISDFDVFDFHLRDQIIESGRRAARSCLSRVEEALARTSL